MTDQNRRLVLARRPEGMVVPDDLRLETGPLPEPGPGQAVVRVRHLSIDPTLRGWMDDAPGYLPPIGIGEVVRCGGLGEVVASASERYAVGDTVFGMLGWQEHALLDDGEAAAQVVPPGVDPTLALSVLGVTGMTAYFGLLDVGRPKPGETVVVSGAAGATGSVVGQIAHLKEAGRVVGIAGGPEKCAWLVDELGFDAAIDYKAEDVEARLGELCPDGIDVFFDNVGGEILDAALEHLALNARVVLCGAISAYNDRDGGHGLKRYFSLIIHRARMEGFLVLDYLDRAAEAQADLLTWVLEGKLQYRVHVVEGLDHAVDALNLLFTGQNTGKVILHLPDPV